VITRRDIILRAPRRDATSLKLDDPSRSCAREGADEQSADAVPDDLYADAQEDKRRQTHHYAGSRRSQLRQDPIGVAVTKEDAENIYKIKD